MFRIQFLIFLIFFSLKCSAISLSGYFTSFKDNEAVVSVENNSGSHSLVTASIVEVDSPISDVAIKMQGGDVLFSPSKQVIRKNGKGTFKFLYKGAESDKERYFRVMFSEVLTDGLTRKSAQEDKISGRINASIAIGYTLTLPPKHASQQFLLDRRGITNVGNSILMVRAYGKSKTNNDISIVSPLLPGNSLSFKQFDENEVIIGHVDGIKKETFTLAAEE